jgi:plastocyanin
MHPSVPLVLALVLAPALVAGCIAKTAEVVPAPRPLSFGAAPTMDKFSFDATAPPSSPLDAVTGGAKPATHPLKVPEATGSMLFAIDLASPAQRGSANAGDVTVSILDATGKEVFAAPKASAPGKVYADVPALPAGDYTVSAKATGAWKVGVVATFFPAGYQKGVEVDVASREATAVEHDFKPDHVDAKAGAPTRITLIDYDPHEGIDNLQHNIRFLDAAKIPQKTEGKTTWGTVQVLDFTAPMEPGTYEFECEFHHFKAVLVVS